MLPLVRSVGSLVREGIAAGAMAPFTGRPVHHYGTKTLVRELVIPPMTVLEGHTHRYSTVLIVLSGSIDIILSHGERRTLTAGSITTAPPMTKRAVATAEGATVLTVHHTEDIDVTADDAHQRLFDLLIVKEES